MHREFHRWRSPRLGYDIGVVVYGHWGPPAIAFPTSGGDEWEFERQRVVGALADYIDGGRVKLFTAGSVAGASLYNRAAHPFHRSWMLRMFDEYVRDELIPFVQHHCRTPGTGVTAVGASLGAFHAANAVFKHPDVVKRCIAMSGVYDMRRFMDGMYDENFYFNNPVDYLPNLSDPWALGHLASCDIHIVTGHGPFEDAGSSYQLSHILNSRGIRHQLNDWGPDGGHDWAYWKRQMREYL